MTQTLPESTRRTPVDLAIGLLVVVLGVVVLGHTTLATTLSVVFVGWCLFVTGLAVVTMALLGPGTHARWPAALVGGLLAALGAVFLRNTTAGAVTLTLVLGALLLAAGVSRLAAARTPGPERTALVLGGVVSTGLGLLVVLNVFEVSLTLIGVVVGVEAVLEGITIMVAGRSGRWGALGRSAGPE